MGRRSASRPRLRWARGATSPLHAGDLLDDRPAVRGVPGSVWALGADPLASWPGMTLWLVVLASSACLTPLAFPPVSDEGVNSEARSSESLVYPITLFLAVSLSPSQGIVL